MTNSASDISLDMLRQLMKENGVTLLLVKELAPNDNAKNQLYLSGSLKTSNILPMGPIREERTEKGNISLKAPVSFFWLQSDGNISAAPGAQLILYPQYPEVRLSGLLRGAANAPNELLNTRDEGRLLFLGISNDRRIVAWASPKHTRIAAQYEKLKPLETNGVFFVVPLATEEIGRSTRDQLLDELCRIYRAGWITSKALNADGTLRPCLSMNCVGYTLEAELGVPRNGKAEPDFKGWEIKASIVTDLTKLLPSKAITLMTPEPTGGLYKTIGVEAFVRKFGYADRRGRENRINFGGQFRAGARHATTKLTLQIDGFDANKKAITKADGSLALITDAGDVAAQWSFAALIDLWSRKHSQAAYVPAICREDSGRQYRYAPQVRLGIGTDIVRLLSAMADGTVYYDPGIKIENESSIRPTIKRRSQFRANNRKLDRLYERVETVSVCK